MSGFINDLGAFAKLGKVAVAKVNVDMNKLVRDEVEQIQKISTNIQNTKIVFSNIEPAFCDPGLMKQVWNNLIGNALKYSSKIKNAKVEIGSKKLNKKTVYYIKDNGAGFDMKDADKLFKVFERLHKSNEFEGTGIGLSTVERIITKHGGKIWAEGKLNKGAVFYFTLPPKS